jgi:predicted PurR-regulated permease PerM
MINKLATLPFYAKASLFFVGLYTVVSILSITQSIVVPLIFALIIAIVLHPVVNFFVKIKVNRIVAIIITLTLTIAVIGGFGTLLYSQAALFSESWPTFVSKFTELFNESVSWASGYFDISASKIEAWIKKTKGEMFNTDAVAIKNTIVSLGSGAVVMFVLPVYTFLFLYYKPLLMEFLHKLFSEENHSTVGEVVSQIKTVVQRYLVGLILEVIIIAVLNSVDTWNRLRYPVGHYWSVAQPHSVYRRHCSCCIADDDCHCYHVYTYDCIVCFGNLLFHSNCRQQLHCS